MLEASPSDDIWTVEDAAAFLSLPHSTIRRWIRERHLPVIDIPQGARPTYRLSRRTLYQQFGLDPNAVVSLLTIDEAASQALADPRTVYRWIGQEQLQAIVLSPVGEQKVYRVQLSTLNAFLLQRAQERRSRHR